jgi:hypothetical protein
VTKQARKTAATMAMTMVLKKAVKVKEVAGRKRRRPKKREAPAVKSGTAVLATASSTLCPLSTHRDCRKPATTGNDQHTAMPTLSTRPGRVAYDTGTEVKVVNPIKVRMEVSALTMMMRRRERRSGKARRKRRDVTPSATPETKSHFHIRDMPIIIVP